MPVAATDTDTFQATIQRPSNGELADSASLSQFVNPITSRTRYVYNRSRSALFDVTRAPYSADPTGAVSSQTAIADAIAAAAVAGGDVFIPPGTYLYTGLSVPQGVNIYGALGVYLVNTGAGSCISFTQPNDGPPSIISGIRFSATAANTATCVVNNADARAIFERCAWNGYISGGGYLTNLQGKIAVVNSASSELDFVDCRIIVAGTVKALHVTSGKIRVRRGTMLMPAVYSDALGYADSTGEISFDEVLVNLSAHTTGTAEVMYTTSTTARGALRDCTIDGTGATGVIYGHLWTTDSLVVAHGNRYIGGTVTPYGNSRAADGSRIQLEPTVAISIGSAPTLDLTNSGRFKSILVKGIDSCVVTLPAGIFPGQELLYTHFNADSSAHNVTFATTPLTGFTIPNPVGPGNTLSCVLVWESRDVSGSYRWVQKGTWGTGLTLV